MTRTARTRWWTRLLLFPGCGRVRVYRMKNPAGVGRRWRSWCRASWPAQDPSCAPGDPCGAARASRPRKAAGTSRPALPPGCPIRKQPAATAILHGLARRTAPQTEGIATRSRASRWTAGRLTDLYGAMSALPPIPSAPPPAPDMGSTPGEGLKLTHNGSRGSPIRDTLYRRLQPLRYLHDCSGCFRLERWPGGTCTHWKSAALPRRTP